MSTFMAVTIATESSQPLTWILIKSTGIVAVVMLTVSVVVGIVSPAIRGPSARLSAISIHSAAAATGVLLLVGHVAFAIADTYVEISPLAVIVPGISVWEPTWIGLGVASLDFLIIIVVSSAMRRRSPTSWRRFHMLAYPALALAWGHALTAGTDRGAQPMLLLAIGSAFSVALAMVIRISRGNKSPTTQSTRNSTTEDSKNNNPKVRR